MTTDHPALVCAVPIGADGPISYASCKCGWRVEGPLTDAEAKAAWDAHLLKGEK